MWQAYLCTVFRERKLQLLCSISIHGLQVLARSSSPTISGTRMCCASGDASFDNTLPFFFFFWFLQNVCRIDAWICVVLRLHESQWSVLHCSGSRSHFAGGCKLSVSIIEGSSSSCELVLILTFVWPLIQMLLPLNSVLDLSSTNVVFYSVALFRYFEGFTCQNLLSRSLLPHTLVLVGGFQMLTAGISLAPVFEASGTETLCSLTRFRCS